MHLSRRLGRIAVFSLTLNTVWLFLPGWQDSPRHVTVTRHNSAEPRFAAPKPEISDLFFQRAKDSQEPQAVRFQLATSVSKTAEIYASILWQLRRKKPASRSVILVPWRRRAEEIQQVLEERGFRTSLLAHQSVNTNPHDTVVVCLFASAQLLTGGRFDMKIIDEAGFLRHSTKTKAKLQSIPASLVGEFSFTFGTEEVDHKSSIQAAIATDELRPVECFALPMATSDRQKRWTWLAHLIQRQWQNWPGSIGVAFYRLQAAKEFAQILGDLGIDAEHAASGSEAKIERASKKVWCFANGRAEDFGVSGLQTVILAEPTRQPSSLKYLQYLLQSVRRSILIEVLDGTGKPSTVQKRVESYSRQLMSDPLPRPPQLLDMYGRSFPCSKPTCQQILHSQGWAEERFWLRSLHSWLLEHRRKPRSHAEDPVESRQATRLNVGYNYLQQQIFSEKEEAIFGACTGLLKANERPREWTQSLCRWVSQVKRKPRLLSDDAEERKQAKRWRLAKKYLELRKLSDAEIQLVEMSIEMAGDSPPREWLRSLHSWLASHGKPRWTADPVENLQAQRLRRAQVYLKAGKLNKAEEKLMLSAKKILSAPAEPREWMRNLTSWVMSNGRKPLRHADAGERLQAERWKSAKGYLKMGKLNAAEKQLFCLCTGLTSAITIRPWLQDLHAWVQQAKRRPNENQEAEKQQAARWCKAAAHVKKGKLNEEERALFLQCKKIVSEKKEVRDWLQSLHGWVTLHQTRPHWNASNPEEKLQAERLKRAQLLLKGKRGKLNPTEEQLLLNCTRTLGLVPSL